MVRRSNLEKPEAMHGAPEAPTGLKPVGKTLWKQAVASRPASQWTKADCALLGLYCNAWADIVDLDVEVDKRGCVERGMPSVAVRVRAMREKLFLDLASKLRLCPASRYTAKDVGRLHKHATKANAAIGVMDGDDDDLLGRPMSRGAMQ